MKDEIKEILYKAKEISDYGADGKQHTRMFNQFEAKALLDYITNLQKEVRINNDLIPYLKNKEKSLKKQITNLQQENEFLKLSNPEMNMEHFRIVKENKRKIDNLRKENERLKKLNENASKVCVAEHKYGVEKAEEARDYKSRINKVTNEINRIIEIIQEQPGKDKRDDLWVLDRLDGLLRIVSGW